ncbi:histidinol-phosphate transaminase [Chloroflexota bacterium]
MKNNQDAERLIRADIARMKAYTPIIPIEVLSEHIGISAEGIIKLDGNENPYGCSPNVQRVLASYPYYHIYPDPEQRELRKELEEYTGISADHIVAGSGSDELIELIMRLFIAPGDKVINCTPTFGMYSFLTEVYAGEVIEVPRDKGFAIDLDRVKKAIKEGAKIIFIASPNNPSGNTIPEQEVLELLETGLVVVIDEAYYEFCGETMVPLVLQHGNLIVLRTFSKWAGIAGLRVGYGVFPRKLVGHLMKIKQPYNVNVAAQVAAIETLRDPDYRQKTIKALLEERERLLIELAELKSFQPLPSRANFILSHIGGGEASRVHHELQQRGIFVRYFDNARLKDYLRISIGKPEQTDALISALKEIC